MTPDETSQIVHMIKAAWPRPQMGDDTAEVYMLAIRDLDFALAKAAVLDLVTSSKWMPAIAEIRQSVVALMDDSPTAGEAWAEVVSYFGSGGSYGYEPDWSCETVRRAVAAVGGFKALCLSETGMADRAHFLKIYETLQQRVEYDRQRLPESRRLVAGARLQLGEGA